MQSLAICALNEWAGHHMCLCVALERDDGCTAVAECQKPLCKKGLKLALICYLTAQQWSGKDKMRRDMSNYIYALLGRENFPHRI